MKEYILCAAIWYEQLQPKYENKNRLPVNIKNGIVICGHRHHTCIGILNATTGLRSVTLAKDAAGKSTQGFITNINRFVDRAEAFLIAKEADQILETSPVNKMLTAELHSEDLY